MIAKQLSICSFKHNLSMYTIFLIKLLSYTDFHTSNINFLIQRRSFLLNYFK